MAFVSIAGAEPSRIIFNDGSTINAEVISLQDGVYTLSSESLGEMIVPADQINSIISTNMQPAQITPGNDIPGGDQINAQINAMTGKILSDPQLMQSMTDLMNDPEVQKILSDPAVMNAVNSGDIQTLMNNPKLMELMNNPNINSLINQMNQ
jgi:hypothetical protein